MQIDTNDLIGTPEARSIYGCSKGRIFELIKEGKLTKITDKPILLSRKQVEELSHRNKKAREAKMPKMYQ